MITFQKEDLADLSKELLPLLEQEFDESGEEGEFENPLPTYVVLRESLIAFTARDEGRLVGYVGFLKFKPPYIKSEMVAQSICWYVLPEYRGITGIKMLKEVEPVLANEGITKVLLGVKFEGFERVLDRLGYGQEEITYSRRIK